MCQMFHDLKELASTRFPGESSWAFWKCCPRAEYFSFSDVSEPEPHCKKCSQCYEVAFTRHIFYYRAEVSPWFPGLVWMSSPSLRTACQSWDNFWKCMLRENAFGCEQINCLGTARVSILLGCYSGPVCPCIEISHSQIFCVHLTPLRWRWHFILKLQVMMQSWIVWTAYTVKPH
jgi:hypothetical protein